MKLVVVSSRFPFSNKEPYLRAELAELLHYFEDVTVIPARSPHGVRQRVPHCVGVLEWPLMSVGILGRALRMFLARPRTVATVLADLAASKDPGHVKNAFVVLKGLALGQWAREHHVGHIHAYWLSIPATIAMIAGKVANIPWSATAHRWDIYERNALALKAHSAAFVRTISMRGTRDLQTRTPELAERIVQMPIGTVVPKVAPRSARAVRGLHIMCPAALVPVKGHTDLLDALVFLRDRGVPFQCTIAGEGPLRAALERAAKERGFGSDVLFAGFLAQEHLHERYRQGLVDVVVLASREEGETMEGVPCALIEAMAYGVPVVSTSSGSIGELIDESCGRIVRPADPEALAAALADAYFEPFETSARAATAYARVCASHDVRAQMRTLSERIHSCSYR